jgi:hypothetical protein
MANMQDEQGSVTLPVYHPKPPPQWLEDVLQGVIGGHGSEAQITCVCGREHVGPELAQHDGPEEEARLLALSETQPDRVIFHDDMVHAAPLNWPGAPSGEFVFGCSCNALTLLAGLIEANPHLVAGIAAKLAARRQQSANAMSQCAQGLTAAAKVK